MKTTQEYLALLEKSGVLADANLVEAKSLVSETSDVREFARLCVTNKWLTDWQARFLMTGRHRLKVGHYRLLDHLPKQAIGDRFRALHQRLDRNVDVWLLPKSAEQNKQLIKQFLQQAALVAELDHPNLLHVYDIDKDSDRYYLVFESETGVTLSNVPEKSLKSDSIAKIVQQTLQGTRHAHEHNVLHGKLEASHIRVDEKHAVKINGFGLTKLLDKMIDPDSEPDEFAIASDPSDDVAALGRIAKTLFQKQVGQPLNNADVALFSVFGKMEQTSDITNRQTSELIDELGAWLKSNQQAAEPAGKKQSTKTATAKKPRKAGAAPTPKTDPLGKQLWIGIAVSLVVLSGLGIWYLAGGFNQGAVAKKEGASDKPTLNSTTSAELPKITETPVTTAEDIASSKAAEKSPSSQSKTETPKSPTAANEVNRSHPSNEKSVTDTVPEESSLPVAEKKEADSKLETSTGTSASNSDSGEPKTPIMDANGPPNSDNKTAPQKQFAIDLDLMELQENSHANLLTDSKKLDVNNPILRKGFLEYQGPDVYIAFKKNPRSPASAGVANVFNGGFRFRIIEASSGDKAYALNMFRLTPVNLMEEGCSGEMVVPVPRINLEKLANAYVRFAIRDNGTFYISNPSDNLAKGNEGYSETILNVDAKAMQWQTYAPVKGELDDFSGATKKPEFTNVDFVGFLLYGERSAAGDGGTNFGVSGFQAFVTQNGSQTLANAPTGPVIKTSEGPPKNIVMDKAEGLPLVSWEKTADLMDKEVVVFGKIVSIGSSRSGKTRYMNFVKNDRDKFKIVVRQQDLEISEESLKEKFLDKNICIRGKITTYDKKPQVLLTELVRIITVENLPGPNTQLVGVSPSTVSNIPTTGVFAGMPGGVAIPELTKDNPNFQPVLLGPVKIGEDPLGLFLTVPAEASSRPLLLEIQRDQTGKRWEVLYAANTREIENKKAVAEINLKEDQLFFNWIEGEPFDINLNFLQNCLLEIKTPEDSKTILLRKPQSGPAIQLDEKRAASKMKLALKYLPKPEAISIEFLPLPKAEFETQSSDTGMTATAARPEAILYFDKLPENQFFRLAHSVGISKTIKIDSALQINSPGKATVFNSRNIRELKQNLGQMQRQINQANQVAIQYNAPHGEKTKHKDRLKELSKQLDMINAQVLAIETALPTAEQVLSQKLKYRVYFNIGDLQFDLMNSSIEADSTSKE
ncbi:MAG: protein kinase [Pirellulaceae bacterium]|nr:protein kinase [Pirellulaceae bacterium]